MRSLLGVVFIAMTAGSVLAAPRPTVAAIHVDASLLQPIVGTVSDIQKYVAELSIESLGVSYKDGKAIEQWREVVATQTRVVLDVAGKLKQVDSIALAVILSQSTSAIRDGMNSLSSQLQVAGQNSTSAAAVRATMPLTVFTKSLLQPSIALDQRVQAIAAVGDAAVRACLSE